MTKFDSNYTKFIKELAKIVSESGLDEIEIKEEETRIKITKKRQGGNCCCSGKEQQIMQMSSSPSFSQMNTPVYPPAPTPASQVLDTPLSEDYSQSPNAILSPMVGVIYTSKDPESPAYVQVGSSVQTGDTVLLIEAMKVFNPIKAHKSGKVSKILVSNSQIVEFNEPLIVIE